MALTKARFRVHLTDGTSHDVDVIFGDLMRGELEAHKSRLLPADGTMLGLHMATIYAWCAMQRLGLLDPTTPYAVFKEALLDGIDNLDNEEEPAEVDPTQPAPSGSPSN